MFTTKMYPYLYIATVAIFLHTTVHAQYIEQRIADLCSSGSVDAAARIELADQQHKIFLASGKNFWLLNVTGELPDESNIQHLPYNFEPDVALFKDSTGCSSNGKKTLVLIEKRTSWNGHEAEWILIEGWLDGQDLNWSSVQKIAFCDLRAQICTTTNDYFATMGFDWKRKLDAAFGVIGETAYFIQGHHVFKVSYQNRCIQNPYKEVHAFDGVDIGTKITAAMQFKEENNVTVVLFDHDMHFNFSADSLEDIEFDSETISDGGHWHINGQEFFDQCPKIDSALGFLAFDFFASSSKHFAQRPMVVFITCILVLLFILTIAVVGITFILMSRRSSPSGVYEINDEGANSHSTDSGQKIDSNDNGTRKEEKTLLQTSC